MQLLELQLENDVSDFSDQINNLRSKLSRLSRWQILARNDIFREIESLERKIEISNENFYDNLVKILKED